MESLYKVRGHSVREHIGDGVYSSVFAAQSLETGEVVAVKIVHKGARRKRGGAHAEREVAALRRLSHANVIRYISHYEDAESCYIVMELVRGIPVGERVFRSNRPEEARSALCIGKQTLSAIQYIHSQGVYHLDIKPENVLIADNGVVKLIDFGCSVINARGELPPEMLRFDGTPAYMAPEMVHRPRGLRAILLAPLDVWGFGCFIYYISTGHPAFSASTLYALYPKILKAEVDYAPIPHALREICRKIFIADQRTRIEVGQLLSMM